MSRKRQSHGNPSLEDLPEELILDMLSRLPGTTLIYCKCVCKTLRNLVSEIRLPKCLMIYQFENTIRGFQPRDLKLVEIKELNQNNLLHDPFMCIDMTKLIPGSCINIEGSVDGLVCFTDECERTYICNPMTREYMIIPKQKIDVKTYCRAMYGFGVSLAGEYKVIRIVTNSDPIKIEVYTLGTYQWRNLDVPRELNIPRLFGHGLYFNGHFYWISDNQLLSFNMDKEKFQLVPFSPPPPPRKGYTWLSNSCLGVLKGCLCYVYKSDNEFTFWVMTKEHKMKKYWHKELDIANSSFKDMYPKLVIEGSNDQSILIGQRENCQLIAYCLEINRFEDTTLTETCFRIYNYRPSYHKLRNVELSARIHVF